MTDASDKIIVALDVPSEKEAMRLVSDLHADVAMFKVGLQLYTAAGAGIIGGISSLSRIFLDLKLHDIPNTVGKAVESAEARGVEMLTIHLGGGSEMIRAATAAKGKISILGVTVLTSANEQTLRETGISERIDEHVLRLAKLGVENGIDGIVASPHEVNALRTEFGDRIKIIVPGIRPNWAEAGDQKRFTTPREAIEAGADYLVIGRPITAHKSPRDALAKILAEISG
ncbi:MAG TPA: orotidine-5'-phosphate decarboxylase [Chthoniobacterales bacterium]|nr:orotidine-5'-phosphate decarboxylase [Chthoniobacterales bacterium]